MITITLSIVLACLSVSSVFAGEAGPAASKAKQEGEPRGWYRLVVVDEIIAKAKKEGKLRLLVNMDVPTLKAAAKVFTQKYPFIDVHAREITGSAMIQRKRFGDKSGQATREWDVAYTSRDFYSEYLPYLWKVDLLRMAEQGVLQIPTPMIDPQNRNIAAFYSRLIVSAYNKNLVPADQVPKAWEDFVKLNSGQKVCCGHRSKMACLHGTGVGSGKDSRLCAQTGGAATHLGSGGDPNRDSDDGGRDPDDDRHDVSQREAGPDSKTGRACCNTLHWSLLRFIFIRSRRF
jgi:hypothetical protein